MQSGTTEVLANCRQLVRGRDGEKERESDSYVAWSRRALDLRGSLKTAGQSSRVDWSMTLLGVTCGDPSGDLLLATYWSIPRSNYIELPNLGLCASARARLATQEIKAKSLRSRAHAERQPIFPPDFSSIWQTSLSFPISANSPYDFSFYRQTSNFNEDVKWIDVFFQYTTRWMKLIHTESHSQYLYNPDEKKNYLKTIILSSYTHSNWRKTSCRSNGDDFWRRKTIPVSRKKIESQSIELIQKSRYKPSDMTHRPTFVAQLGLKGSVSIAGNSRHIHLSWTEAVKSRVVTYRYTYVYVYTACRHVSNSKAARLVGAQYRRDRREYALGWDT